MLSWLLRLHTSLCQVHKVAGVHGLLKMELGPPAALPPCHLSDHMTMGSKHNTEGPDVFSAL
jgi:hypothetical protein